VETDVSDVHAALESGAPGFVLVDSRSTESWTQGHVPGAVHLPGAEIAARADAELDRSVPVATYCWGPGCNGATRAAAQPALSAGHPSPRLSAAQRDSWSSTGMSAAPDSVSS
jgi:rhodanese-related sulfurtransferase